MKGRYIVFDVETPNARNDRMSAIGVAVVENGMIVDELSTVVNPETYFHPFNIALTGITPAMAEEGPDFSQLWADLEPVFSSGLLVAHNAPFDMSVLAKCLRAYCVDWQSTVPYACTVQMGGFAAVGYSGAAPALGYTALAADGLGGVQSAGEAEGGVSRWVVDRDESGKTVTILL